MCWKCDHPGSTTEQYLAELRQTMLMCGWLADAYGDRVSQSAVGTSYRFQGL